LRYVINKWGPELAGKDLKGKAYVDMLTGVMADIKQPATGLCYTSDDKAAVVACHEAKMPMVAKFLEGKKFLVGDSVTVADF
jgi:hypothetical protein